MKGIILAGGSGTRLYPLTSVISKQLLPVYDKPMICYPLATLMLLGIQEILIISTPHDTSIIENYLGDGKKYGLSLQYCVQNEPKGIAEAFLLGEQFIDGGDICLILGDNIFYLGDQINSIRSQISNVDEALIFGYHVNDPKRFGIMEFSKDSEEVISLEEKPQSPKSNYAAVGLYFYPNDVVKKTKALKPSERGELEITDLNLAYLNEGRLKGVKLKRGAAWMDAGTPESLLEASNYIGAIEHRQGLKIACLEEVAYRMHYISDQEMLDIISAIPANVPYSNYLMSVIHES